MSWSEWSTSEIEVLKRMTAEGKSALACAIALDRTEGAVFLRRQVVGISEPKAPAWSAKEDAKLRAMTLAGRSILECAIAVGRSEHAVSRRRRRLGLIGVARQTALAPRKRRLSGLALAMREGALADGQTGRFCRRLGIHDATFRRWLEGADPDLPSVLLASVRTGVTIDDMLAGRWVQTFTPRPQAAYVRSGWAAGIRSVLDPRCEKRTAQIVRSLRTITGRSERACERWLTCGLEPSLSSAVRLAKHVGLRVDDILLTTVVAMGDS